MDMENAAADGAGGDPRPRRRSANATGRAGNPRRPAVRAERMHAEAHVVNHLPAGQYPAQIRQLDKTFQVETDHLHITDKKFYQFPIFLSIH